MIMVSDIKRPWIVGAEGEAVSMIVGNALAEGLLVVFFKQNRHIFSPLK